MAGTFKSDGKRSRQEYDSSAKPKHDQPRAAPSFVSTLKDEETDFPRGGGTSLTALEVKQTRAEGRREAEAEVAGAQKGVKRRRQISEREAKRLKKNEVDDKRKERDKDTIRVEELNYKRLVTGTRLLTRVHTVLPLHLVLSLPNNLLAHVPITEISSTLTTLLHKEEASSDGSEDDEDEESSAPDLATLFQPGQYFPAKVLNLFPTASQSFISQYPVSETTRLAARVEMTLMPEKVNAEVVKADLAGGFALTGEVLGEEDKGWRVGLGLDVDIGMEGWISREEVDKHVEGKTLVSGQLVPATISGSTAGGRILQLSLDPSLRVKTNLGEVSNIASILPGHLVSALITAVVPSGLNLKVCGFFDGTIDLAHLDLKGEHIDEKYKIGKKLKARVLYDNLNLSPKRFGLTLLPHLLELTSPVTPDGKAPLEIGVPIGKMLSSVKITRVIQEWGVMCRTDDGLEGFVHISHISDERIPALSGSAGPYRVDTLHRARVIGHSPLDGMLLLSFEQKVLDQVFMQVDELKVGQQLKGTIHKLGDKGLFVNIAGSVHGVVWPQHYADIRLKNPEKRFKIGGSVKARVFALEPARSRVVLTLKKSLVDSELEVPEHFGQVQTGMITPAVVTKILDKGCIVDLFGGLRAFVPQSEASQNFIVNLHDIFFEGKPVNVRITEVNPTTQRLVASVRQALPTALAATKLEVMDEVSGLVSQIHADQVVITLIPSQITALLSLSNLSNHRHIGVEELRAQLKVGERLDDLVVISKNDQTGLVILSNKRAPVAPTKKTKPEPAPTGISAAAKTWDSFQPGMIVRGKVISHTPQGSMIQLGNHVRGRVHPTDAADDFETIANGQGPLNIGEDVECYILTANPATRIIDLSTRRSRVKGEGEVVDPELAKVVDVKPGMKVRGLVKNVSDHGVFVALGRAVTARVMIKELFDEFVKDWESRFEVNQLVSGTITSVNETKKTVEMSLRKEPGGKRKDTAKKGLSEFEDGQIVDATVKKVEAYGMFLQIEGTNISGLCHKSQISDDKTKDVSKALQGFRVGDRVKAVLIEMDREKGRVNFSIKPSLFGGVDGAEGDEDEEMQEDGDEEEDEAEEEDEDEDDDEEDDEEDLASGDELDLEDDSDEDVEVDVSTPAAPKLKPKTKAQKSIPTLSVTGGFDWSGDLPANDDASDSSDESESESAPVASSSKSKKSKRTDLTATAPSDQPSSALEFERALLASPNSSFLWIQYMSFLLQLHEIDKARAVGRKALEKIALREEEEKLNVWMALVNLEIGFGTTDSREKVWKEAAEYNDKRTVWARYADALVSAGKQTDAEEVWRKYVKKFSQYADSWTKAAEFWFKAGNVDEARDLLPRSMKSLDKAHHVEAIKNFAVLEFRHADAERGKTLFEELVDRYPKRLDIVSVYMDQLVRVEDISGVRALADRALGQKLTAKKAKFLFKKLLMIEGKIGDAKGEERAKDKAREWVLAHAKDEE